MKQNKEAKANLEAYQASVRARIARIEAMLREATESLQRLEQATQHLHTDYLQKGEVQ